MHVIRKYIGICSENAVIRPLNIELACMQSVAHRNSIDSACTYTLKLWVIGGRWVENIYTSCVKCDEMGGYIRIISRFKFY